MSDRVQRATDQVVIAEIEATQALESVSAMLEGDVTQEHITVVEELLRAQQAQLQSAHKALAADIIDARKTAPKLVQALSALTPRIRTVQASLAQEYKRAKRLFAAKQKEAEEAKKAAEEEQERMEVEQRDTKAFEDALPAALELVTKAVELVDDVATAAAPLAADPAQEQAGGAVSAALTRTEGAVQKVLGAIKTAQGHLSELITAAKEFAPAARKAALAEYSTLQEKLHEAQAKVAPYVEVRKGYEQRQESAKVLRDIATRLGTIEVETEKAMNVLEGTQPSEEEVRSAEATASQVMSKLASTMKFVEQSLAAAHLKNELAQMRERGKELKAKLDGFKLQLRRRMDKLQLQAILRQGLEKTQAVEDSLVATAEAEAPFLKGAELLASQETQEAVAACKQAAKAADASVAQARAFLSSKLSELARFPDDQESASAELEQLRNRVEAITQKLAAFKRETATRESSVLLKEVTQRVADAEGKVQQTAEAAAPLAVERLEEVEAAKLKEAVAQTLESEKAAALACAQARKVIVTKQKEPQAKEFPAYAAELSAALAHVTALQQELGRQRKVAVQGEKVWKGRLVAQSGDEQVRQVEEKVDKAEVMTTPLGDESPSDARLQMMDEAVSGAQAALDEVVTNIESAKQAAAQAMKPQLAKLLDRCEKCQGKLDEMKESMREQRERVACSSILKLVQASAAKVEEGFQQVSEAELPYLTGVEVLPQAESKKALADADAAVLAVQQAIVDVRNEIAARRPEVREMTAAVAEAGLKELDAMARSNAEAKARLAQFQMETEGRRKLALRQEACEMVSAAEAAVERVADTSKPLCEEGGLDALSQEAAQEAVKGVQEANEEAEAKIQGATSFLLQRKRDKRASMDVGETAKLAFRVQAAKEKLEKCRAATEEHEQKVASRMVLEEAQVQMLAVEEELDKATEAAAPLLVEGGRSFVAAGQAKQVFEALAEHCAGAALTREELFARIGADTPTGGKASEAEFMSFLERVPELCAKPDLAFSAEQRGAIFGQVDGDQDGLISKAEFLDMFHERFICVASVAVTDSFDVSAESSRTLDKLEVDDVVEALGEPKPHSTLGIARVEMRVLKDGTTGWATTQGNQGTTYLAPLTAYAKFMRALEQRLGAAQEACKKAFGYVDAKAAELAHCSKGPLLEAKATLGSLRPQVGLRQVQLDQLRKRIDVAKREHAGREEEARRRREEGKDRKAAALVLETLREKVEAAKAALAALEEAAAPLVSIGESELSSFAQPVSVRAASQAEHKALAAALEEAKACLGANLTKAVKAARGPWHEVKQEMLRLKQQSDKTGKSGASVLESVERACDSLRAVKLGEVSAALRGSVQQRAIDVKTLFDELAGKGKSCIAEEAFGRYAAGLPGISLAPEHMRLIFEGANADGLGRRAFFGMLERYYKCVKGIAITCDFDIKASATLRKLEAAEVVEVLEGPKSDDSLGVMRIRAKALSDGTTGWITAKGNQGTPFLLETAKPCLYATTAVALQDSFLSAGCEDLRTLKTGEVVEILEGPRRESTSSAVRVHGKATLDGATGWLTVKTRQGESLAEPGRNVYRCTMSIALTDGDKIGSCSVIRKLQKGESLQLLEGPVEDPEAGVMRIKAKAAKDEAEGWVTTRGNAGSIYVEESGRQYVVLRATPLQSACRSDRASTVRMLDEQETVELLEGPQEEKSDPAMRVRCRAVADGTVGWATLAGKALSPWSPKYRCVKSTSIGDALELEKANSLRQIAPGEVIDVLDGPHEDPTVGVLRLRGRLAKDAVEGWVTVAGKEGSRFLECVAAK